MITESVYSIKDLAGFSGVKAHTIRMWEQRYNLLEPTRTDTNIRRYAEADLKKLLNVSLLCQLGYKISHIAHMADEEINKTLLEQAGKQAGDAEVLNVLKICTINFDERLFYSAVDGYLESHDMFDLFKRIYIPFLNQVGLMWQANSICPAHEHFVSNLIRQQVAGALNDMRGAVPTSDQTFVLFLPSGEMHELSLLMLQYLMRNAGHRSIYLGQSVPAEDLQQLLAKMCGVHFVSIFTAHSSTTNKSKYLDKLSDLLTAKGCFMHLAGRNLEGFEDRDEPWMHVYPNTGVMIDALLSI